MTYRFAIHQLYTSYVQFTIDVEMSSSLVTINFGRSNSYDYAGMLHSHGVDNTVKQCGGDLVSVISHLYRNRTGNHPMSSSSTDDSSDVESWVEWFLMQEGHEFFCEVDRGYIEDTFNLYGLRQEIPHFKSCLNIILDISDISGIGSEAGLDQHVMDLYGKIHARYILTKRGMERMLRKYRIGEFGVCPMMECAGQPVLPMGLRDQLRYHEVYPALRPTRPRKMPPFVPRVFGFKVRMPPRPGDKPDEEEGQGDLAEENARLRRELERLRTRVAALDNGTVASSAPTPNRPRDGSSNRDVTMASR
eukprot:g1725.t1